MNSGATSISSTHSHARDDQVTPEKLAPLLQGTVFASGESSSINYFHTIPSTNTAAMQAAGAGAKEGSVFIADEQIGGRGRGGQSWHSAPRAGIYLSVVLRPSLEPSETLWLSLLSGLAAHDAISLVTGSRVDLRWPNDIMLGEKKLGGVLTELSTERGKVRHVVVGIGLNVNNSSFPGDLRQVATSLRLETGHDWPRLELTAALLKSLDTEYSALQQDASGRFRESVLRRFEKCSSYACGAMVEVDDSSGEDGPFRGVTVGLDGRGFLLVETTNGVRTVINGGVRKI